MSEQQPQQSSDVKTEQTSNDTKKDNPYPIKYEYELLPEDYTNFDISFKLIVIGDSGVGKSSLTNNAVKNVFEESYNATVGFEFFTFNVRMCGKVVKLQIWDTCGQELYRSLITNFYRNSSLAVIVYAINSKETFENIEMWIRELRTHSSPDIKIYLIGNKADLEKEREVTKESAEEYCKLNKIPIFMEASAKTGLNAQNIFLKAAEMSYDDYNLYKSKKKDEDDFESGKDENKKLGDTDSDNKKGGCC